MPHIPVTPSIGVFTPISAIFCVIMTVVVSFILIPPTYLINRYLPWTTGRLPAKKSVD